MKKLQGQIQPFCLTLLRILSQVHLPQLLSEGLWADLGKILSLFHQDLGRTNKLPQGDPIPLPVL